MELCHDILDNCASFKNFRSQEENPGHLIDEALNLFKPMLLLINTPPSPLWQNREIFISLSDTSSLPLLSEIITHQTRTNLIKSLRRKTGFVKEGNAENQARSLITSLGNLRNGKVPSSGKKKSRQRLAQTISISTRFKTL
ncbi:hypothetical protein CEXT_259261 [Caerostris extrusa]|uniref:Uncharacterized protein n=1 Tax=Caerostris extrusa TaxID=172846 RepID=A0AAV4PDJ8_CAEEX|nr:hypothetical protein CEXT_259261 [Caerostris extrusa]